jgi:NADP-dependent 3-hydroxy acid dehydrogenase YdfG
MQAEEASRLAAARPSKPEYEAMPKPVCVIAGVGPGNGAAIARKFASELYSVALCARSEEYLTELAARIPDSRPYPWDVTDVGAAHDLFRRIHQELGPVETLVYNAGSGAFANFDGTDVETLERAWQVNARGLFVAVKEVLPEMRAAGRGNIVVIGATASLRGMPFTVPFAQAKAAQRSLAQSMARTLGPEGIHVSYLVIDGVIDIERTRKRMPDKPDEFFLAPDDIAESVYFLAKQPRSAWTFELDVRPFGEKW